MPSSPPRDVLARIRKLAALPDEIRRTRWAVPVTRLTVLKWLCRKHDRANRFVAHLARKTIERVGPAGGEPPDPPTATEANHREMMQHALAGMEAWQRTPTEKLRHTLSESLTRMRAEQDEYRNVPFGAARVVTDSRLLLVEYALSCHLAPDREAGTWAYQAARQYAERYAPSAGTGLTARSVPPVQDIVDFWTAEYALAPDSLVAASRAAKGRAGSPPPPEPDRTREEPGPVGFTHRQGQFLAFIHLYRRLHRRGPAEADLVHFFRVTPPAVHGMVVKLGELGLVTREPGVPRSLRVAVPADRLPVLEDVDGPPW